MKKVLAVNVNGAGFVSFLQYLPLNFFVSLSIGD